MFGLIKNSIKTKIGIVLPASYPASRLSYESVSVTGTGSETIADMFNRLFSLVDGTKITNQTKLVSHDGYVYSLNYKHSGIYCFVSTRVATAISSFNTMIVELSNNSSWWRNIATSSNSIQNLSSVSASGYTFTLYY